MFVIKFAVEYPADFFYLQKYGKTVQYLLIVLSLFLMNGVCDSLFCLIDDLWLCLTVS